jgi:hypothetical protein
VKALLLPSPPLQTSDAPRYVDERSGLLAVYPCPEYVEAGGLMSIGPSYPTLFHRVGAYVSRILTVIE